MFMVGTAMSISHPEFNLQLNQAVQVQIQGQEELVFAMVTSLTTEQIVLRFPELAHLPEEYAVGVPVQIRCRNRSALVIAATEITALERSQPSMIIAQPKRYETIQQRRLYRVDVDFPCSLEVVATANPDSKGAKDDDARVLDLSTGGARILTHSPVGVGDLLQLKITPRVGRSAMVAALGLSDELIELRARVVRVGLVPGETGVKYSLAVGFADLSTRFEDRLVDLIFNLQLEPGPSRCVG
jgi:c-di-GMP-binding flagellar brake protein YcgR